MRRALAIAAAPTSRALHLCRPALSQPPRTLLQLARRSQLRRALSSGIGGAAVRAGDPYATLGLERDASLEQVKLTYYKLAMVYHPDRSDDPDAAERFAEIGAAYNQIMGLPEHRVAATGGADGAEAGRGGPRSAAFAAAFPRWVYRAAEHLHRLPQQLDAWLAPSFASIIYQHVRANELAEALSVFEDMRAQGERPSNAVYEMLIRGCTLAMRRPPAGGQPDHLTVNLVQKVLELWGDMQKVGRKADYLTYIELLRALGKGGALPQALALFERMCGSVTLLPEERAFNTIYEACVLGGNYKEALRLYGEQAEMRKSLWKPRFTPVSFSLLLTAAADAGPDAAERVRHLPSLLDQMGRQGVLPRKETCERLLGACLQCGELEVARRVALVAERAGHTLDAALLDEWRRAGGDGDEIGS